MDLGYDMQAAAYLSAATRLMPEMAGRIEVVFLFAEVEPPYCVLAAKPSAAMWTLGEVRWMRAVELWARCLAEDEWPGYASEVVTLEPPAWALAGEPDAVEALE